MKTKIDFNFKRKAVYEYYKTRSKDELASLVISLMYAKDILSEYKELPTEFKRRFRASL
jgi:hypothetical protein